MGIGRKIIELRTKKGFSQERLAEESGISLRTIQRIETDNTKPTGHTLRALTSTLDTSLDFLLSKPEPIDNLNEIINKINLSALIGLVVPFGNVILPFILWKKEKHRSKVNLVGRRILSFQLIWTISASLCFLIIPMIQYELIRNFKLGYGPITWGVFIVLVFYNIFKTDGVKMA